MNKFCLAILTIGAWSEAGYALDQEEQRGRVLLETLCARCHAIGATVKAPILTRRHFELSEELYDDDLGQRLQEGLTTIHADMPTFHFRRRDAEASVNYLKSIQRNKPSK
jgi:cytochrome c